MPIHPQALREALRLARDPRQDLPNFFLRRPGTVARGVTYARGGGPRLDVDQRARPARWPSPYRPSNHLAVEAVREIFQSSTAFGGPAVRSARSADTMSR